MTGVSKYSDYIQKRVVEMLKKWDIVDIAKTLDLDIIPSDKTLGRWIDKWTPIILKEIADKNRRQDKTTSDKIGHDKKKVRQDNSKFIGAQAAWLGLYPSMIKRYTRFGYGNMEDMARVVNDYFVELKKEVDK